ncbi:cholesterol oxidase substrate-binding domain-containing protein [Streptomyces sp. NPDC096205]|uniref:cholesterol oxidase substrate-binding domain-containing protein n=1 Tax=Streptomyces sp. NPDC096205 TaxID=3366081 RepID=UPI00381061FE
MSLLDIPADELFARPGTVHGRRSFAEFLDRHGRAEAIWFAFTDKPVVGPGPFPRYSTAWPMSLLLPAGPRW